VRNIIADDDSLQQGVRPALREYNIAQFITADVPGHSHQSIVSEFAMVKGSDATETEAEGDGERFFRSSFKNDLQI